MRIERLSQEFVSAATTPGYFCDGGNLYLQVRAYRTKVGLGISKTWIFRYRGQDGKTHDLGLGSVETYGIDEARVRAKHFRRLNGFGVDLLSQQRMPPMEEKTVRFIRLPEVLHLTGLAESTLYDMVAKGTFPKPVPLSARARAWVEGEVNAWVAERISNRDVTERRRSIRRVNETGS